MIIVSGRVRLKAGARDDLVAAAQVMCPASRDEAGCHAYRYGFDVEDDEAVLFHEEWADEAALQEHFTQPHFTAFVATLSGLVEPDGEFTKWVGAERRDLF